MELKIESPQNLSKLTQLKIIWKIKKYFRISPSQQALQSQIRERILQPSSREEKRKKGRKEEKKHILGTSQLVPSSTTADDIEFQVARDPFIIPWKRKTCPVYTLDAPLSFSLAPFRHPSRPSSPSPPHGFKAFLNPPSFSLHPVQPPLCQAGFLINPSTPLINDRCPSPFYDQRFRSPLIDADHHGFLTPFLTPPLLNGDRVSRADRCASGDDTF